MAKPPKGKQLGAGMHPSIKLRGDAQTTSGSMKKGDKRSAGKSTGHGLGKHGRGKAY